MSFTPEAPLSPTPTLHRVDLLKLSPEARADLLEQWLRVRREYFPESTVDVLEQRYTAPELVTSRAGCLRDAQGVLVGIQVIVSRPVKVDGQRYTVLRSSVVKSRSLERTPRAFDRFGPGELVRQALAAHLRGTRPWVIATSQTPVTYHRIARFFPEILPAPDPTAPAEPARVALLRSLAREIGMSPLEGRPFCARGSGLHVSDEERARWEARGDPTVRRYLKECPDFGKGPALLFGFPVTLGGLVRLPLRMLR